MKRAIIIMAKVPISGTVKTRLQSIFTGNQCCELATCFLRDAESKLRHFDCQSIIAFSPKQKEARLRDILRYDHLLIDQRGEDLGDHMFNALEFAFDREFDSIVMIGTDSPTMPAERISEAFEKMEKGSDAVLGKTADGGFYLIGLNILTARIFDGIDWGTENVFEKTKSNLTTAGLKTELLEPWYDVDHPKDIQKLKKELDVNPKLAVNTAEWLKKF